MRATVATLIITGADAHGAMTHPRPRNAFSSPATEPSSGGDKSCTGDACYWYQVGCHIGCPSCTLTGKSLYPGPHCTKEQGLMEPTNNEPQFRTWDPLSQSECGDFTKYNPWRAPGKAPVVDPCGVASGMSDPPQPYAAIPNGYQAAQKGSEVLPETSPTYWKAGGTAQVGWGLSAQHGGGYSYRLCPKGSKLSEECFQANTLRFATANSTIHFNDGSHADITIPTQTYNAPDGSQWRTNPIPGCACDLGAGCGAKDAAGNSAGHHADSLYATGQCTGISRAREVYPKHGSPTSACPSGTMFEAGFDQFTQGFLGHSPNEFSVMDEIQVPIKPGEYVLGWRWDCEETDQVWNSCADIVITDGPIPAPTPAPPTPPAPSPSPGKKDYVCYMNKCYEKPGYGTMDQATCEKTCSSPSPPPPSPSGNKDYLCYNGKCYEKPGYGTLDKDSCEKTCSSAPIPGVVV